MQVFYCYLFAETEKTNGIGLPPQTAGAVHTARPKRKEHRVQNLGQVLERAHRVRATGTCSVEF